MKNYAKRAKPLSGINLFLIINVLIMFRVGKYAFYQFYVIFGDI